MTLTEAKANFITKAEAADPLARVRRDPLGSVAGAALAGFALGASGKKTLVLAQLFTQYLKNSLATSSDPCR